MVVLQFRGGIFYEVARMARKSLASYFDSETKGKTQPTTASPGSVRKQVVFAIRVWRDEELHHMDDRKERDHDTHQAVEVRRRLRSAVREFLALREAVPEINGEILEAVATGRLSFDVLDEIRGI